jgi:hypothetical protein
LQGYRLVVRGREAGQQRTRAAALGEPLAKPRGLEALGRVKSALPSQIESLFTRHPALYGFSVRGAHEVPDNYPRHCADANELFVGDIGVSPALPDEQFGEIFDDIVAAVSEVLAEGPQAGDELRGRTFARALH